MIVRLGMPPLAAAFADGLAVGGSARKLDANSSASRRYLSRLESMQKEAAREIREAIPGAVVSRRFQVVLDGLTVELPVRRLPDLAGLSLVTKIYPSYAYRLALDESPGLIRAGTFWASTGLRGEGMKIAVVDDGVDNTHAFLAPTGMSYPPGFPKGGKRWTSPKVIVARAFPGPSSGRPGRLPLFRDASFHGTHVAGIAAGRSGTFSPGGPGHPPVANLSGVAPNAWVGNYRVFNVPTRVGFTANTPEIVAAFEAAVRDGMDVINFSGGGTETDPANDAMIETVRNVSAAGVVPVISAGNSRDDYGLGSIGSPGNGARRDHGRSLVQRARLHTVDDACRTHGHRRRCAACRSERRCRYGLSAGGTRATRRSWTSARSAARTGGRSTASSAASRTRTRSTRRFRAARSAGRSPSSFAAAARSSRRRFARCSEAPWA